MGLFFCLQSRHIFSRLNDRLIDNRAGVWYPIVDGTEKGGQRMIEERIIHDFRDVAFTEAFRRYFEELGISVRDWEALWEQMNEGENTAILHCERGKTVGFLQYQIITSKSWFFEERLGFVREFWIDADYRGQGYGSALLARAEQKMREVGIARMILTTDSAEGFYRKQGYRKRADILAKNRDCVYVKDL
ncbi:MAG: GNAT family N-acetyltransferase [Ruminococcaceae bacterium]|nr:GNAT family N-acetyltransferase [Oscillospiraceae bacterium]